MDKKQRKEWLIFSLIILVAVFFRFYQLELIPPGLWPDEAANGVDALKTLDSGDYKIFYPDNNGREGIYIWLQALSIKAFGATPLALRLVSAIIGVFTVVGLYFLSRYLYDWRLASIASFFLAISFWHVNFSRIGFRAIMLPLVLVWGFYFLWRGIKTGHLAEYLAAGVIGGLGFYTYFSYRIVPLIAGVVFINYWAYLKKDFHLSEYEHARNQLLRGFTLVFLTVTIMTLPLMFYFYGHPGDFLKREGAPISVFDQQNPIKELIMSITKTLGMFNFSGDWNRRHNIPSWPMLSLPVGILFAVGFLRELIHWLKRKHGHFSNLHTFLLSWFFIMLLPGFLSTEAPHGLRTIGVLPVVMIFAAQGFMWLANSLKRFHKITDFHAQTDQQIHRRERLVFIGIAIIAFMVSVGFIEYSRYFNIWAKNEETKTAFTHRYLVISDYLNRAPLNYSKYVIINEGDVVVDGVPNNAQTIRFLTRTFDINIARNKKIYYLNKDNFMNQVYGPNSIVVPLLDSSELAEKLELNFGLRKNVQNSFNIYTK